MIQHPAVMSLLLSAFLITVMCLYASFYGIKIILHWDMGSGSELQLGLERRTYLISTILGYALLFQMISFFLLIYTADSIHSLFTGAMCAAGTLGANTFGYPLLLLKLCTALLCGVWLTINSLDNQGYDYPLIRKKYAILLCLSLLLMIETFMQFKYFVNLKADLITSCCGSLFSTEKRSIAGELAALPAKPAMLLFAASLTLHFTSGAYSLVKRKGWLLFSASAAIFFLIAIAAIISFISLYFYQLPTHHCPFCLLQKEYWHIGYLLYGCLIAGAIAGVSTGVGARFKTVRSLAAVIPVFQRRGAIMAMGCNLLFTVIVVARIITTSFRL